MDIGQIISDNLITSLIVTLCIALILLQYLISHLEDDDDDITEKSTDTYDIRCTVPGQKELVFQGIPEDDFNFNYDDLVYVERYGKSYYLPIQYTTVLPNE